MTELSDIGNVLEDISDHLANLVSKSDDDSTPLIPFIPDGWKWAEPEITTGLRDGAVGYRFRIYKNDGPQYFEDSVYVKPEDDVDKIDESFSFVLNMLISSAESYGRDYRQEAIDKWVGHIEFESLLS